MTDLVDPFGRTVRDLRISVTDRCNLRCRYCMPADGLDWLDRSEILSFEEMYRVARICVERFGFDGIRLTGGEPTVRAHLPDLIRMLAGLGVDLALTTNGATLGLLAGDLKLAGLGRITISVDSLQRERFAAITRRDALHAVLDGIDAAMSAGFAVKLNAVMMRGVNDDEIVDFATFGRERGVTVRFIEYMPLDAEQSWDLTQVVTGAEIIEQIDAVFPIELVADRGSSPAERWRYRDGVGEVGIIPSVTRSFCGSCDRARLTADGRFLNCLFAVRDTDLRSILRSGGGDIDDRVARAIESEVGLKWAGHSIGRVNFVRPPRSMSQIGG